jgi:hypothetical protein
MFFSREVCLFRRLSTFRQHPPEFMNNDGVDSRETGVVPDGNFRTQTGIEEVLSHVDQGAGS